MKSLYLCLDIDNEKEYLSVEEKDIRALEKGEVLIQVEACCTLSDDYKVLKDIVSKNSKTRLPAATEVVGTVKQVGPAVSSLRVADRVLGVLPLISDWSACASLCILKEHDLIKLPDKVDAVVAVSSLGSAIRAYTALHFQARVAAGEVVLVLDAASAWGLLAVQLSCLVRAKVIAVIHKPEDRSLLEKLHTPPDHIIDFCGSDTLLKQVLEESGGLGVDVVIDNGVCMFSKEDLLLAGSADVCLPRKHDVISMLGLNGRWITSQQHLQLDPPNCDLLHLRGASVSFLFPSSWMCCPSKQGKLQHIMFDFTKQLSQGTLRTHQPEVVSFQEILQSALQGKTRLKPGVVIKM